MCTKNSFKQLLMNGKNTILNKSKYKYNSISLYIYTYNADEDDERQLFINNNELKTFNINQACLTFLTCLKTLHCKK